MNNALPAEQEDARPTRKRSGSKRKSKGRSKEKVRTRSAAPVAAVAAPDVAHNGHHAQPSVTVLFAGGGSGGHISPGLAIAERLAEIDPNSKSIFVCSQRAIDLSMLSDAKAEFVALPATPPSLRPLPAWKFARGFVRSRAIVKRLLRQRKVDHVVALGGFIAAPAVSAAKAGRVPVTLVNLDAPPGRANQWIAKRCTEVISAIALPGFPNFAKQIVGMPIRRRAIAPGKPSVCRTLLGLDADTSTLLITGASQGATSLNAMMIELAKTNPTMFKRWQVVHLTGDGADDAVKQAYKAAGITAKVEPFLNEIGLAWGAADLAISRAGASCVAEAAHNAVPTIFMPYPYHKDMHQKHNAQPLVDLGGAVLATDRIEPAANAKSIGPGLGELMAGLKHRQNMRKALESHPLPDAAATIAQMLIKR
ncbi:MAG: UDP-N-acetylglucosamine--N-acetylmuramyl-(pentapeptide) pyrophosphoryl-undecaprenol N-acetylglucosamine transferase [Phycisphaerales bacterium]|nr:UDP-N-acetylglucosamine--N-acetylmuramyl-(pentapeptide) pyrophosphoryl-undecaprenol N-acetylglucosamine transferase [Phycisphaerales bacterium]